jgi:amino acid transporter
MDERQLRKKHDRELIELLNELRVALPGVQVLFAFLLVAPFSGRFDRVSGAQEVVYMVALLATLVGTVLLMAPSAYHRLRWRERNKERMLRRSNQLAIAGLACVALAMTTSVLLVTDVLFSLAVAVPVTVVTAALFGVGWFVLPLSQPYDRWDETLDYDPLEFD